MRVGAVMNAETEVVGGFLQIREVRERYANAILHEVSRLHFLLRRDEVQRAALVVFAPAAPVGEFRLPAIHLLDGDGRMLRGVGLGLRGNSSEVEPDCDERQHGWPQHGCGNEALHGTTSVRYAWSFVSRIKARTFVTHSSALATATW